jgi:hypothetical protein
MRRFRSIAALLVAGAAIAAPVALATDFAAELSSATPEFTWEASGNGVSDPIQGENLGCGAPQGYDCDYIVLDVKDPGTLKVALDAEQDTSNPATPPNPDLDLYLYKADAEGAPEGEPIAESATEVAAESLSAPVTAGKYVAVVEYWWSIDGSYAGTAKLETTGGPQGTATATATATVTATATATATATPPPSSPPSQPQASPPPPSQQAAPAPAPKAKKAKKSKRKACIKKAKKTKNAKQRKAKLKRCKKIKG